MPQQTSRDKPGAIRRIFSNSSNRRNSSEEKLGITRVEMAQSGQQVPAIGMLKGPEKLAAVTELMGKLGKDLEKICLLPQQRDAALEELKVYGRDPTNAEPIYTKEGIEILTRHAFNSPSSITSRNSLRCLCNAMLLKADTRQMFVDLGYESKACNKLKNDSRDDEFLVSRILFLTTYGTDTDILELIDKYHLAENIIKNLERHARTRTSGQAVTDPMEEMALTETLKLLFNITHFCKDRTASFTRAIPPIVTLLCKAKFETGKPLDSPIMFMVNALLNLELGAKDIQSALYPQNEPKILADLLVDLLSRSRTRYNNEELENSVTPLIGVMRAVHEHAPEEVKASMRSQLLPTEADRSQILGRSGNLASWLLQNSTNPVAPQLREGISDLLFDLSDRDASKFVENVGYGFASGFLMNRNMDVPQNATEAYANAGGSGRARNPVTGQYLDAQQDPEGPEMTQEEKEQEAEKLFILFERLRANGVISAENPVRTAQQQGRFEELPDDYDENVD